MQRIVHMRTKIKKLLQVFDDGNIEDHISDVNEYDFYAESCFGIVFPEKASLKTSLEILNGYEFSKIPMNYQGPFQNSEDNVMRIFLCTSCDNIVTNYLVLMAWDELLLNSVRRCVQIRGDPLLAFLLFIRLNENQVSNFPNTAFNTIQCYTSNKRKKIMLPT